MLQGIPLRTATAALGKGVDDLDEGGSVFCQPFRCGDVGELGVGLQVMEHGVLEDGAADGDAEGLAESAEEGEHGDGEGHVAFGGGGLDGEGDGWEEDAQTDAGDEVNEDPGDGGGGDVE